MELTFSALPSLASFSPAMNASGTRVELATFAEWREALSGPKPIRLEPCIQPQPTTGHPETIVMPMAAPSKPNLSWHRALKIFTPPGDEQQIHLDDSVWEDEFKATEDWNTKPSRVETFLTHYDKNQTLTTLAIVALLILWIY